VTALEGPPAGQLALGFDEVVHQRTRLGILAVLAEAGQADFTYLRQVLDLTDGNLGRHLEILAQAGLLSISKGRHQHRPRTWAAITGEGRRALEEELARMREMLRRLGGEPPGQRPAAG
jgi:DNA-binding MarR family transcriptional regulator